LAAAAAGRPNIIFLFTDDQRYDALGAVDPAVKTPNLDRLAARGTRYANAFVTLSICSPSRAAVMTGQYGSVNGVTTLSRAVVDTSPLLPKLLRDAGYRTGMYGKWHLSNKPAEIGFDEADYFTANGTFYGRKAIVDGKTVTVPGYIDEAVADWSVAFIKRAHADRKPFFLWHCTQVPHMDHTFDWPARQAYLDMYDPATMPLPATWQDDLAGKPPYLNSARSRTRALEYGYHDPAKIRRHVQRYRAAVTQMDATLGRVIDTVGRLGLCDSTWFVFMGDNGWQIGEHGFTSKVLAYEESIRVPMLIAGPDTTRGVDERLALNIDLAATILDIAGIAIPATMHGRSLLAPSTNWRDAFVYEAPTPALGAHPVTAVRDVRWKLIRTYDPQDPQHAAFTELYDLQNDPHEMHNLAAEPAHADRVARMAERIAEHERTISRKTSASNDHREQRGLAICHPPLP
jgi:arylsulfatase A-like enzyme